jgi:hypothetical protein
MIANITALSFLVEQGRATVGEVVERLGQVQKSLPADYRRPAVKRHTDFLAHQLSERYGPKKPLKRR